MLCSAEGGAAAAASTVTAPSGGPRSGTFYRLDPCRPRKIALTASNFRESFAKVGLGSRERKKESWAILKESLTWAYSPTACYRRFRVSAASLGISSIAQEAREPPPRRSTSSSTLDGHVVAVASPAGLVHLLCCTNTVLRQTTARRALSGPHRVHAGQWSSLAMSSPSRRATPKSEVLTS